MLTKVGASKRNSYERKNKCDKGRWILQHRKLPGKPHGLNYKAVSVKSLFCFCDVPSRRTSELLTNQLLRED